jgi:hypothetical protein
MMVKNKNACPKNDQNILYCLSQQGSKYQLSHYYGGVTKKNL